MKSRGRSFQMPTYQIPGVCSLRWRQCPIKRPRLLLTPLKAVASQIHTKPRADWFQILQRRSLGSDRIDFSETVCWTTFKRRSHVAVTTVRTRILGSPEHATIFDFTRPNPRGIDHSLRCLKSVLLFQFLMVIFELYNKNWFSLNTLSYFTFFFLSKAKKCSSIM